MKIKYYNYCLNCKTKNCYNRSLKPKVRDCLEVDYKEQIRLTPPQKKLISRANKATAKAFERKVNENFALTWLLGFIKEFFGTEAVVGIASCLGSVGQAGRIVKAFEAEGIKTAVATCKLGGLTIDAFDKDKRPYKHPGCNPIAQAKILNKLNVSVVILVSLCIGHDMIFIKNCKSYVIPFMTKIPITYGAI